MYRQGDVLIVGVAELPEGLNEVGGPVILAQGEATGHAHVIAEEDVELLIKDAEMYLRVPRKATVVHQEHAPVALPAGDYRVIRQREYSPRGTRYVAD